VLFRSAQKLAGRTQDLCKSPHGNFVLSHIIQKLSVPKAWSFIIEDLRNTDHADPPPAVSVATSRYGYRVLCDFCEYRSPKPAEPDEEEFFGVILDNTFELSTNDFGHHVICALFEHQPWSQQIILGHMLKDNNVVKFAEDKHAVYVLEKALKHLRSVGDRARRGQLEDKLSATDRSHRDKLKTLTESQPGSYTFKELLEDTAFSGRGAVAQSLVAVIPKNTTNKNQKRLLQDMVNMRLVSYEDAVQLCSDAKPPERDVL